LSRLIVRAIFSLLDLFSNSSGGGFLLGHRVFLAFLTKRSLILGGKGRLAGVVCISCLPLFEVVPLFRKGRDLLMYIGGLSFH